MKKPVIWQRLAYESLSESHQPDGLKFPDDSVDNHVEMSSPDHNRQPTPLRGDSADGVSVAFAAFVLTHSGCGKEASELRLDDQSLFGWCWRCNDLRIFTSDERHPSK